MSDKTSRVLTLNALQNMEIIRGQMPDKISRKLTVRHQNYRHIDREMPDRLRTSFTMSCPKKISTIFTITHLTKYGKYSL